MFFVTCILPTSKSLRQLLISYYTKPISEDAMQWVISFELLHGKKTTHGWAPLGGHDCEGRNGWARIDGHIWVSTIGWARMGEHELMGTTGWALMGGHEWVGTNRWAWINGNERVGTNKMAQAPSLNWGDKSQAPGTAFLICKRGELSYLFAA